MSVVVRIKIAGSGYLDICTCRNNYESVDSCTLEIAEDGLLALQIMRFLFSMPVVYQPHPAAMPTALQAGHVHAKLDHAQYNKLKSWGNPRYAQSARGVCAP